MNKLSSLIAVLLVVALASCKTNGNKTAGADGTADDTARVSLKYAKGFTVKYEDGYRLVEIQDPQKTDSAGNKTYRFALVPRGTSPEGVPQDCRVIETPVRGVICMTSLQLSGFIKLDALDHIVGITSSRRLFNKKLKQRIDEGKTVKIGKEGNFDDELVMAANPDVIFVSLSKRGGYDKLEEVGLPLVPYMGYLETGPLAQAEWIKFVGLFTGKSGDANRIFAEVEKSYAEAKAMLPEYESLPTVLYGKMHGNNWYVMGGGSYIAQIFSDAGAHYFLDGDDHSGGVNIDFETVYAEAAKCDFWVIQNKNKEMLTYRGLKEEDGRYADFGAWQNRAVVCCEMSHTPINELSPMEPDVVLKDFIKAFHPELLPDWEPVYYMRLPADQLPSLMDK